MRRIEVHPIYTAGGTLGESDEIEERITSTVKDGTHRLISLAKSDCPGKYLAVFEVEA